MIKEFSWNGHIEKAELIKFTDIQCGDILWIQCIRCKSYHRCMSLKFLKNHNIDSAFGTKGQIDVWETTTRWPHDNTSQMLAICESVYIYRVINPVEDIHNVIMIELADYLRNKQLA